MKRPLPRVGLRNIKTALAVVICLLLFLPFWAYDTVQVTGLWQMVGPINACVAAIICMQSSLSDARHTALVRLRGTAVGGLTGMLIITIMMFLTHTLWMILLLGLGMVGIIWFCNLIEKPAASGIACIVCCIVVLAQVGETTARYVAALARMGETAVGILVSVGVNRFLPGTEHHAEDTAEKKEQDEKAQDTPKG